VLIIAALLAGLLLYRNRPVRIHIVAELPADFPQDDFPHNVFEALLEQYVDKNGNIDYDAWHRSDAAVAGLDAYLAAVARYSPDNSPHRFPDDSSRLAYWIYSYNAYVIRSVVHNWPIESVTDLKAPVEIVTGMGFFYRLRFSFGGEFYSLLHVENNIIRKRFHDPRIHFVLNCASESCPPMRPALPTGSELEALLSKSALDFVSDPQNVAVDHASRQIILSTIFKWFRKDFVNDLRRRGMPWRYGLLDYIASIAPDSLRDQLDAAVDYEVVFRDYDWTLNVADQAT
jgi:hypothetical protein